MSKSSFGQECNLDSLWNVWQNESHNEEDRAEALFTYIEHGLVYQNPDSAIKYSLILIEFGNANNSNTSRLKGYMTLGHAYKEEEKYLYAIEQYNKCLELLSPSSSERKRLFINLELGYCYSEISNNLLAITHYQNALDIGKGLDDTELYEVAIHNIGSIYYDNEDFENALKYFKKGLVLEKQMQDTIGYAESLTSIADAYLELNKLNEAKVYVQNALEILSKSDDLESLGDCYLTLGKIEEVQKNLIGALEYYYEAKDLFEKIGYESNISYMNIDIGMLFLELDDFKKSLDYCQKGLKTSKSLNMILYQMKACECIYLAHKAMNQNENALFYHEEFSRLNDSLFNEENTKEFTRLEMQYEFDKKEAVAKAEQDKKDALASQELKQQKLERNGFMAGFGVVLIFAVVFFAQRNKIGKEKDRSDELLLNILPEETAQELKAKGSAESKLIEDTTVLFTDFEGFTAMSENVTASDLVKDINECFSAFDHIMEKHGVEKIKTIGDAYMAAGGLPTPNKTHVNDVVLAALEIADFMKDWAAQKEAKGEPHFDIRIGVNTGPVVAGIVGVKKFQYDIWGDTVNTASRMESAGAVGKVNISESTYIKLKDVPELTFAYRGEIEANGIGKVKMWFVNRINI
jgi:class 3 adenylate cyclase